MAGTGGEVLAKSGEGSQEITAEIGGEVLVGNEKSTEIMAEIGGSLEMTAEIGGEVMVGSKGPIEVMAEIAGSLEIAGESGGPLEITGENGGPLEIMAEIGGNRPAAPFENAAIIGSESHLGTGTGTGTGSHPNNVEYAGLGTAWISVTVICSASGAAASDTAWRSEKTRAELPSMLIYVARAMSRAEMKHLLSDMVGWV
ncbi:hypothetical protein ACLOJK_016450 [Asimina triloba]